MSHTETRQPLNRFPRMMQEYLVSRMRENYRANHARVMGLKTRTEAEAYCAEVRAKVDRGVGPWPEKTPLNLRIACAAILWADLVREYGDDEWREPIRRALGFCRSMQFTRASDPNLEGAILEKVLPPAGSDAPPWYLRELGTVSYVQALCQVPRDCPEVLA